MPMPFLVREPLYVNVSLPYHHLAISSSIRNRIRKGFCVSRNWVWLLNYTDHLSNLDSIRLEAFTFLQDAFGADGLSLC